jgi:Ni,Fe-hydrogenase III small subunit
MPQPSVLVAAGSAAINGGQWAKAGLPGLTAFPISHYADVQVTVPGDPPTPQAFVAGLSAAASALRSTGPEAGGTAWED